MKKICNLTGKIRLKGNKISFSKKKSKKLFKVNFLKKKIFKKKFLISVKILKIFDKINNFLI